MPAILFFRIRAGLFLSSGCFRLSFTSVSRRAAITERHRTGNKGNKRRDESADCYDDFRGRASGNRRSPDDQERVPGSAIEKFLYHGEYRGRKAVHRARPENPKRPAANETAAFFRPTSNGNRDDYLSRNPASLHSTRHTTLMHTRMGR